MRTNRLFGAALLVAVLALSPSLYAQGTFNGGNIINGTVKDQQLATANKPAVGMVAVANLTLSGVQTIDGSLGVAAQTLVLATAETSGVNNGPWIMQIGAWTRPAWYPSGGTTQAQQFAEIKVRLGTVYQNSTWRITTAAPVTIDTTATTWVITPSAINSSTVAGGSIATSVLPPIPASLLPVPIPCANQPALTGNVTTSAGGCATTIGAGVVTPAMQANIAANSIIGNNTGSAASPSALTQAQVTAFVNGCIGDSGSGGIKGAVPAPGAGDAAAGKVLKADCTWQIITGTGNESIDVQVFNGTSGTWTKAFTVGTIEAYVIGAGGGGASGGRSLGGCNGGGGGGSGGFAYAKDSLSSFPSTVSVIAGAGGAGGVAETTNTTINGNSGSAGGASSFGTTLLTAPGGGGGPGGGQGTAGATGTVGFTALLSITGVGLIGGTGGNGSTGSVGNASTRQLQPASGAGAGGFSSTPVAVTGSAGGATVMPVIAGGTGGTNSGTAGASPATQANLTGDTFGGAGGGSGGGNSTTTFGAGGAGARWGGGGGGGTCSINGIASGAGGAGGNGGVIVISMGH